MKSVKNSHTSLPPLIDYRQSGKGITLEKGFSPETIRYAIKSRFDGWVYMTCERERNVRSKRRRRRSESHVADHLDKVPLVLADPDKVIVDPEYPDSTHIYYRRITLKDGSQIGLAVPVCSKEPSYVYTVHSWKGKHVKGETRGLSIAWLQR